MRATLIALTVSLVALVRTAGLAGHAAADGDVAVEATEYRFVPDRIRAEPGAALTVTLTNAGQRPHDIRFELDGGREEGTDIVAPGGTGAASFLAPATAGTYVFYCSVGNHRAQGMEGALLVGAVTAEPSATAATPKPSDGPGTVEPTDEPTVLPTRSYLYLPLVTRHWPPVPARPVLEPIDNSDLDSSYSVQWRPADLADGYVLYEARDGTMRGARAVQAASALSWRSDPPRTPGTYHYQVVGRNAFGDGQASAIRSVTVHPLFVGMLTRWEGQWAYNLPDVEVIKTHLQVKVPAAAGPDTVNVHSFLWTEPNPLGSHPTDLKEIREAATGRLVSKPGRGDPDSKWRFLWVWDPAVSLENGRDVVIDGQVFAVSGPHSGQVGGVPSRWWQLENREAFTTWESQAGGLYRVGAGQAKLSVDTGGSSLLLAYDILETIFDDGRPTETTIRSSASISESNALAPVESR